jgi:hypothetical protein
VLDSPAMKLTAAVKAAFRRQGSIGGKTRAKRLTKAQRVAQAKHAAAVRWGKR